MINWNDPTTQDRNARHVQKEWNAVATRFQSAAGTSTAIIQYKHFLSQLEHLRHLPIKDKACGVDVAVNRLVRYQDDCPRKSEDKWKAPHETLFNRGGDCEDFCFLKYAVLQHLGVPSSHMMFAAVDSGDRKPDHAVLLISNKPKGFSHLPAHINDAFLKDALVLDNRHPTRKVFQETPYSFYLGISMATGIVRKILPPTEASANDRTSKKTSTKPAHSHSRKIKF